MSRGGVPPPATAACPLRNGRCRRRNRVCHWLCHAVGSRSQRRVQSPLMIPSHPQQERPTKKPIMRTQVNTLNSKPPKDSHTFSILFSSLKSNMKSRGNMKTNKTNQENTLLSILHSSKDMKSIECRHLWKVGFEYSRTPNACLSSSTRPDSNKKIPETNITQTQETRNESTKF